MTPQEALARSAEIITLARHPPVEDAVYYDFANYAKLCGYLATSELTENQRASLPWLKDWALTWRKLYDRYDKEREADPMIRYRPKHSVSEAFHASEAFLRYYMAGNGTSKTQSGYAEDYFVATNQHRWRYVPSGPHSVFIVGLEFTSYSVDVFEKKMLNGEEGNYLSPMFPDGGKWFHSYLKKEHQILIACTECAEAYKAKHCRHPKSSIKLYSDKGSWEQLQGSQHLLGHFDEHVDEGWYSEAMQRLKRVDFGSLIVTGTPLFGTHAWEVRHLLNRFKGPAEQNKRYPSQEVSAPQVAVFNIDQFSAGIIDHDAITADMVGKDRWEIDARIYGKPAPLTKHPVFDRKRLDELADKVIEPKYYVITSKEVVTESGTQQKALEEVLGAEDLVLTSVTPLTTQFTGWRIWEMPEEKAQYLASVDSAKGLIDGDASCCSILKMTTSGMRLKLSLVAQFHGWINTFEYGDEVFKGAVLYNDALTIIELTGGYGEAVMLRLKKQLCYWNVYRPTNKESAAEFSRDSRMGVDTNVSTKPFMIAALQQFIKDGMIDIPCIKTVEELANYEQQTESKDGKQLVVVKFGAAGGAMDDRVMSLALGAGVVVSAQVFDMLADTARLEKTKSNVGKSDTVNIRSLSEMRLLGTIPEIEPFDYYDG